MAVNRCVAQVACFCITLLFLVQGLENKDAFLIGNLLSSNIRFLVCKNVCGTSA